VGGRLAGPVVTAPDSRPIHDVIGIALHDAECHDPCDISIIRSVYRRQIAAVVAACQQATVEQQAELLGGEVEASLHYDAYALAPVRPVSRVVGPWREDPS
jgi:hypothetical protein